MSIRAIAVRIVPLLLAAETAHAQGCESVVCVQPAQYLVVYEAEALHAMSTADLASLLAPHSTRRLVLGGVVGWSVGAVVGALLGHAIEGEVDESMFFITGHMAAGALLGSTLGAPFGVNLANGGASNTPLSILASFGIIAVGGLLATQVTGTAGAVAVIVVIPLAQIGTSVVIQRATTR